MSSRVAQIHLLRLIDKEESIGGFLNAGYTIGQATEAVNELLESGYISVDETRVALTAEGRRFLVEVPSGVDAGGWIAPLVSRQRPPLRKMAPYIPSASTILGLLHTHEQKSSMPIGTRGPSRGPKGRS